MQIDWKGLGTISNKCSSTIVADVLVGEGGFGEKSTLFNPKSPIGWYGNLYENLQKRAGRALFPTDKIPALDTRLEHAGTGMRVQPYRYRHVPWNIPLRACPTESYGIMLGTSATGTGPCQVQQRQARRLQIKDTWRLVQSIGFIWLEWGLLIWWL